MPPVWRVAGTATVPRCVACCCSGRDEAVRAQQADLRESDDRAHQAAIVCAQGEEGEIGGQPGPHERPHEGQYAPGGAVPRRCDAHALLGSLRGGEAGRQREAVGGGLCSIDDWKTESNREQQKHRPNHDSY